MPPRKKPVKKKAVKRKVVRKPRMVDYEFEIVDDSPPPCHPMHTSVFFGGPYLGAFTICRWVHFFSVLGAVYRIEWYPQGVPYSLLPSFKSPRWRDKKLPHLRDGYLFPSRIGCYWFFGWLGFSLARVAVAGANVNTLRAKPMDNFPHQLPDNLLSGKTIQQVWEELQ